MGGVAGSASAVYFLGNNNTFYYCTQLPTPSTINPISPPGYTGAYIGSMGTHDITRQGDDNLMSTGYIYVATDYATSPIRAYNLTSGVQVDAIDAVSSVRGMAFSTEGSVQYIWASNPGNNTIYQIELSTTGVAGDQSAPADLLRLTPSSNPFQGSVTFTGTGLEGDAVLSIFDVSGRLVLEKPFHGHYLWQDGSVSRGIYFVRVRSTAGQEILLRMVRN